MGHILVIEDDERTADEIIDALTEAGCAVHCDDGEAACASRCRAGLTRSPSTACFPAATVLTCWRDCGVARTRHRF